MDSPVTIVCIVSCYFSQRLL